MNAIAVNNLEKQYNSGVQALDGLSLSVKEGEIFSLLGPNGAGKSTLIHVLTTYLKPSAGEVTLLGHDLYHHAHRIRSKIACVAQRTSIDSHLSLTENMLFQSKLYKVPKAEAEKRMQLLITGFGLEKYLKYPVSTYSGGVKRRLDIALNLMSNPQILFLDEPTVGMDIQSRMAMWDMVKRIKQVLGTTIFLTTHYLEEADALSDTLCIMKNGKAVIQGSPSDLKSYLRQEQLSIRFISPQMAMHAFECLKDTLSLMTTDLRNDTLIIPIKNGQHDLIKTNQLLLSQNMPFTGIEMVHPTLEEVFLQLTNDVQKEG